jgi:hypothetical protein
MRVKDPTHPHLPPGEVDAITQLPTWYVPLQRIIVLLYCCPYAVIVPPQPHILYGFCEASESLRMAPCQLIKLLQSCLRLLLAQDEALQQVR